MTWRGCRRAVGAACLLLVLVLSVSGCDPQPSFETQDSLDAFTAYLDVRVPALMDQYGVPGLSMALVRDGELVWSGAYGYADREHERPMTVDAVFRAESISKSVTAWGVMRLVEQGLIGLDDPVEQYLDDGVVPASDNFEHVTVRRLLSHSAGLPLGTIGEEYAPGSTMPSLRDYLAREVRLVRAPGAGFVYSNTGFNVLELLIEAVTGRDFAEYMAAEVLTPLGMRRAGFTWRDTLHAAMPTGYDLRGHSVPAYVYPARASGGLFADVEAIAHFVRAGMTGAYAADHPVLGRERIRMLYAPEVAIPGLYGVVADAYGLGHFIEQLPDGRQAVWHGGQGHGWMTHFHVVPASGDAIVILTNSQRSWPVMAQVLSDWARWSGVGAVKMGRITYGIIALRVLIGVVVLVSLWMVIRLVRGLRSGRRQWAPLSREARYARLVQAVLGLGVIAALAWSAAQPYLVVSSIFPGIAGWAGGVLFMMAVVLVLSALFPRSSTHLTERSPMVHETQERPASVYALMAALVVQGLSGLAGGFGLLADPTGSALGIPAEWLRGSPFNDYLVPGLILFLVLGVGPLIVASGLWARHRWSWHAALLVSMALIVWIGVEILVIGYQARPPLQLIYGVLGLLMLGLVMLPSARRYLVHEPQAA